MMEQMRLCGQDTISSTGQSGIVKVSGRQGTSAESDRSDSVGDKMKVYIKKRRNQFPLISAQDANASAHSA